MLQRTPRDSIPKFRVTFFVSDPVQLRVGQKNKLTCRWTRKGWRPRAIPDQRTQSTYLFSAVCPERRAGAAPFPLARRRNASNLGLD
jgi:hypothetical protein